MALSVTKAKGFKISINLRKVLLDDFKYVGGLES